MIFNSPINSLEFLSKIRKIQNQISKIENDITVLENAQKDLDEKLANSDSFKELTKEPDFFKNYELKKDKIKQREAEWENLVLKLNNLKQENDK